MSSPILIDSLAAQCLGEKGFVVVPFLNEAEIIALKDFFYSTHPELPGGMYASSHAPDFRFRQQMNEKIKAVCYRAIASTFKNATPLGATFMAKSKGGNGRLNPHQDWNIVDERRFNSYNIWIPLVDVNKENGTILVLPRSHRLLKNIRGMNIPSSFEKVIDKAWNFLVPVSMKAGEALVYDHRLLHASSLNTIETPRLVVVYGIIPNTAEMRYYFGNGNSVEVYRCTPDFFFTEEINYGPTGLTLLEVIKNENPIVNIKQLQQFAPPQKNLWRQLRDWFNN